MRSWSGGPRQRSFGLENHSSAADDNLKAGGLTSSQDEGSGVRRMVSAWNPSPEPTPSSPFNVRTSAHVRADNKTSSQCPLPGIGAAHFLSVENMENSST